MTRVGSRTLVWVAALVVAGLTCALGIWQMGRAAQKLSLQAEQDRLAAAVPWGNDQLPCAASGAAWGAVPAQQPAVLRGTWWHARTVVLDNRAMDRRTGWIVVTPLQLQSPPTCAGRVVLVQRGWLPRHAEDRTRLPPIPEPSGEVAVTGRLMDHISAVYALGDEPVVNADAKPPLMRQNVDEAFWRAWLGGTLVVGTLWQTASESDADAQAALPLARQWPAPDTGVGKHHAYAVQWFGLSALTVGLTLWYQFILPRRRKAHESER